MRQSMEKSQLKENQVNKSMFLNLRNRKERKTKLRAFLNLKKKKKLQRNL